MNFDGWWRIALAAAMAASAPGCVLYARVPMRAVSSWSVHASVQVHSTRIDGACASVGSCAAPPREVVVAPAPAGSGGVASAEDASAVSSGESSAAASHASTHAGDASMHPSSASASAVASSESRGTVQITGAGRGLRALAGEGVTVDGAIAALGLLAPLGASFDADARLGGDASLAIDASLAHDALPRAAGETQVVLRLAGGRAPAAAPPLRVHLVIDASTSMASTWSQLQEAALQLVARLRPEDELQIVVYGTDAREVLPPTRLGDGTEVRRVIRTLRPEGRTNIEAGLRIAYRAVRPHASIVLVLSDGVPNGGLSTPDELGSLAAGAHARGAITTAIGIGWDFHPGILRALADQGGGAFRIAPRTAELGALLEAELAARGRIAAHDVEVSVALAPGVRVSGALPAGAVAIEGGVRVAIPSIAAGEERVIVVPVAVPPGGARAVAQVNAQWGGASGRGHGAKPLSVAVAPRPVPAGEALAVLDVDLEAALALAANAVTNGDALAAASALRDHGARARAHLAIRAHAGLDARTGHVEVLATALERMVPPASWPDRRALGAAMLSFSMSLGR